MNHGQRQITTTTAAIYDYKHTLTQTDYGLTALYAIRITKPGALPNIGIYSAQNLLPVSHAKVLKYRVIYIAMWFDMFYLDAVLYVLYNAVDISSFRSSMVL